MLGPMRKTETFTHVTAAQVGDVYVFTSGYPQVWSPIGCGRCLGSISESRKPEYLFTVNNTVLLQLTTIYRFKSFRTWPLAKLDILNHLPTNLENVLLVDTDAYLLPWHDAVFGARLPHASATQWLLASRAGSRTATGGLVHSYDGPQPGGALLRLDVLREFQRNCSQWNAWQWPNLNQSLNRRNRSCDPQTDGCHWSWWRCVYAEARLTKDNAVRKIINQPNEGLGEMRVYKLLELLSPSSWAEMPCHVHLDTQTLFDAIGADQKGTTRLPKTQIAWAKNRPCPLRDPHQTAVVHAAAGMEMTKSLAARLTASLVRCSDVNGTGVGTNGTQITPRWRSLYGTRGPRRAGRRNIGCHLPRQNL